MSSAFRHTASGGRHYPCISKIVAGSNNRGARGSSRSTRGTREARGARGSNWSTSSRSTRGTREARGARGSISAARAVAGARA